MLNEGDIKARISADRYSENCLPQVNFPFMILLDHPNAVARLIKAFSKYPGLEKNFKEQCKYSNRTLEFVDNVSYHVVHQEDIISLFHDFFVNHKLDNDKIREQALAKLSDAEKKVLGLS